MLHLEAVCGGWFLRLLRQTLRFDVQNQPPNNFPCVYVFWHRDLLLMTLQRIDSNGVVLVSSSQDGELIAGPLLRLGYKVVRGSSSRQGSQALQAMLRLAKTHSLAITPDGPKGPVGTIHPGLFQLAYLGRIPVIPVAVEVNREWIFRSWDRFRFPKPWARAQVRYGTPIPVLDKEDFSVVESQIRSVLQAVK